MSFAQGHPVIAIPGPSPTPDRVLRAMHRASPDIYGEAIAVENHAMVAGLKRLAGTSAHLAVYIGNGHAGWEAANTNLLNRGDHALVLRYGAQSDYAVQSTPDLRRPLPPPGPLFKLDIDSFWQAADEVPEFDAELILRQADALHEPVRGVFESVITDRLREEVLRND